MKNRTFAPENEGDTPLSIIFSAKKDILYDIPT